MHLFIDTNILLSFYHLTSEDLEELQKLVVLIKRKEIILLLPEQVLDETIRNRASKINDGITPFKRHNFKINFPAYCKDYKEYKKIRDSLKQAEELHSELIKKIESDIRNQALKADTLIKNLFEIAVTIKRTPELINHAHTRVSLGNPPGKNGSIGDAINWESLLKKSHRKITLAIVTDDSDFYSKLDPEKPDEFLLEEWKNKTEGNIYFYRKLSDYFRKTHPKINLKTELEKERLIQQLAASETFAQTHALISNLNTYDSFTQGHGEDLVKALLNNNQIRWIISDDDVNAFYRKVDKMFYFELEDFYDEFQILLNRQDE